MIFAGVVLLIMPLAFALSLPRAAAADKTQAAQQSVSQALREALAHRSYIYLILGYFTCGFQVFFITVHLPAYLVDRGLSADIGAWTIGVVGLFNIIGSISAGYLSDKMPKRYLLGRDLFPALDRDRDLHRNPGQSGECGDFRRGDRASCGCRRCRRPTHWSR